MTQRNGPGALGAETVLVRSISQPNAKTIARRTPVREAGPHASYVAAIRLQRRFGLPRATARLVVRLAILGGRHE